MGPMGESETIAQAAASALVGLLAAMLVFAPLAGISVVVFGFNGWHASWGGPMLWLLPTAGTVAVGLLVARWAWRIASADRGE